MSKVKIEGNASGTGTLTISAPNTNTDRSLTLPDKAGEILLSDGDGSNLTGITTGKVLQVVTSSYSTQVSNSTGSAFSTGLSASITPSSTSSKVLILVNQNFGATTGGASNNIDFELRLNTSGNTLTSTRCRYDNITNLYIMGMSWALNHLHSPSTTSSITYETVGKETNSASKQVMAQYGNTTSTMILMEIAG